MNAEVRGLTPAGSPFQGLGAAWPRIIASTSTVMVWASWSAAARFKLATATVGNSKFYDTMLPIEAIYAALFEDAGFRNAGRKAIRKRNSKKELFEFVVHAVAP